MKSHHSGFNTFHQKTDHQSHTPISEKSITSGARKNIGERVSFEIAVDRMNEKGVFVASQMLATLHHAASYQPPWWKIWDNTPRPIFQFEIIQVGGRIRFFMHCPEVYSGFLESQLYAHYPDIEISRTASLIQASTDLIIQEVKLHHLDNMTIKLYGGLKDRTEKDAIDPLSSITSAFGKVEKNELAFLHIAFSPKKDSWREGSLLGIRSSRMIPNFIKSLIVQNWWWLQILISPFILIFYSIKFLGSQDTIPHEAGVHDDKKNPDKRSDHFGYSVAISIAKNRSDTLRDAFLLREISSSMNIFSHPDGNKFTMKKHFRYGEYKDLIKKKIPDTQILNTVELAGIVHMPTLYIKTPGINWVTTRRFEPPHNLPDPYIPNTPLGHTNFRGSDIPFGIQPIDRARHVYIIGKTGMGKSTLLENMIYSDILAGRGVGLIDPHGDLADTILAHIPKSRTNDIVLFDPSDKEFPIGFNMLDNPDPEFRSIVASGLVSIFKKMFAESWGPRLEYILRNTILSLLFIPDTTLISIPLILTHESYRKKIVSKLPDPILVQFWEKEFAAMSPSMMSEAVNPILNKVGQFLSSPLLRNILGQPKNPFSLRWIMDNGKIFIVNLSKGKIGEDASALLGAMMVTKFQIEAMTRADIPEKNRRDFGLYVDEFQNFATDSFATILSEARKYKLSLTMANQYIAQMPETVQDAVFGNVGTLLSFQVGHHDAVTLSEVYGGEDIITSHDLTNLRKYDIYTKLLIDGMPSSVFSATTFGPLHDRIEVKEEQSKDTLLRVSREKYTKDRKFVEKKIFEYAAKVSEDEKTYSKEQAEYREKMKEKRVQEKETHTGDQKETPDKEEKLVKSKK